MLTLDFDRLRLEPGERVLDLGCGAGRHSFEAARRSAYIVAVDLDDAVLKDVNGMLREIGAGGSSACLVGTALRLPFADGSFDRVIASEVLEHIPSDAHAMAEIERVLKPGGTVSVTVPRAWPEAVCWLLSKEYHDTAGGHVRIYRRGQLLGRLSRAGFVAYASDHAHALHVPYWWLKCLVGVRREDALLPRTYHRFLVWDIENGKRWVRLLERMLDPVIGKSLVLYLVKSR
ncbi:MAG: class I SAM-dependent methyltransferase [Actinomycetota bacterium]